MLLGLIAKYLILGCGKLHEKSFGANADGAPGTRGPKPLGRWYGTLDHTCAVQQLTPHWYCGSKGGWNLPTLRLWLCLCYEDCADCMPCGDADGKEGILANENVVLPPICVCAPLWQVRVRPEWKPSCHGERAKFRRPGMHNNKHD
jgi:hypothetical protein